MMSIIWMIGLAACTGVYLAMIYLLVRSNRLSFAVALFLLGMGFIVLVGIYLTQVSFRVQVDALLHPVDHHFAFDSKVPPLPLPPHTALRFRHSETGAAYFTTLTPDDVLAHFKHLSDGGKIDRSSSDGTIEVAYRGGLYSVTIKDAKERGTDMYIDTSGLSGKRE